jgi:hypothetical protein
VTIGVRRRYSLLLGVVVLAGCGGSGGAQSAPPTAPGFTIRGDKVAGFSIALPKRWRSLDRSTALTGARLRRFAAANPRLRAELKALAGPHSPIRMIAVDAAAKQAFRANMNVIQTRVPKSLSFDELSKHEATQIKPVSAVQDMRQATLRLPAGRALRLTYRVGPSGVVYQYFVRHESFLYVLTYTTSAAAAPQYAKIFDLSAHTFQLR